MIRTGRSDFGKEAWKGNCMRRSRPVVYIVLAVALIVIGAVGYAIWRDSQTNTFEMNFGDETLRIDTKG